MVGSPYWMAPEMMLGKLTFYLNLLEQKPVGLHFLFETRWLVISTLSF